jgi:hypothetical protein
VLNLALPGNAGRRCSCCVSALNCNDLEIGCGGTILNLIAGHNDVRVSWIVFSGSQERTAEGRASAATFLRGVAAQDIDEFLRASGQADLSA